MFQAYNAGRFQHPHMLEVFNIDTCFKAITHNSTIIMASNIRTIGVVGTGVIGSSWPTLFLAKGMKALVSDQAPGAEGKLDAYLKEESANPREDWTRSRGFHYPITCSSVRVWMAFLGQVGFVQEV